MQDLTPMEIVKELDRYIIGQDKAKKAVAIALRNRIRRQRLAEELREEVSPKNIIMIGPTGVGKTEIARRLSNLANVPFLKIEATKFTEVGYVGRDVESMVRDLAAMTVNLVKQDAMKKIEKEAMDMAEEKIMDILLPLPKTKKKKKSDEEGEDNAAQEMEKIQNSREKLRKKLKQGQLENRMIEIDTKDASMPMFEIFAGSGMEGLDMGLSDALSTMLPQKVKKRKVSIVEARRILINEESQKLIDMEDILKDAISRIENQGIIFLDELDKVVSTGSRTGGPDVSREGVQRDLLPIVEGTTVTTRYGPVRTNHILFIAAGTFHDAKPADMISELQGRFPVRVELSSLVREDFIQILTEPRNAIIKQYVALLGTEGVDLQFQEDAIYEIASLASIVNENTEDIGARRLHTIMEKVVENISFETPPRTGTVIIDAEYVRSMLNEIIKDKDLSRYIL
ncbi:HslU--HslV peptidase ATPase subunit [Candidatus Desantisbacteria bacterium CG2_30_40_21]|uniref:ATP-dependent protease ATPase subunit HslU n=5 Tax=unclassified Candidatus Desantisiibacteriota TaxID=3106372 RepID=A0A2M7JDH5_9BACT|nr:MAG: HslU--HslV peptidase ATPase subunit [Candidatus Desantisbacteria bacterium CG2_30_40_21]PIP40540.1 MAG: HslU--HslV peptidase ATPase subunit [Candidatus Desantisbacteria bacterium CG23_combo_of_CG06-09_8_20_14_all_40_23]PIX17406.1 MAG: HslU--HslV peptidase ATPase subunit [Candidatus Desantisbacteria bacterium CG_4_8_14_3_um_filter_40_12]PIY18577.1 MAG: HslU--HslV peptidase ATPase subunit [Candidatus Desantisbacteria bacterium CG_4_10_14_3_um_filter_40_18]PJB29626.1 MAG: HslU--HslV peptid